MNPILKQLYDTTAEDMYFRIGLVAGADNGGAGEPVPTIEIIYQDWSREQLELVRDTFADGLTVTSRVVPEGGAELYIATREQVCISLEQGGATQVLTGPAWGARLPRIDSTIVEVFEAARQRRGGFHLVLRAGAWQFGTFIHDDRPTVLTGLVVNAG